MIHHSIRPFSGMLAAAACAGGLLLHGTSAHAVPALQFTSPSVTVSQVTSGGDVAVISVAHEPDGDLVRRAVHVDQIHDHDSNGVVSYDTGNPLSSKAIWAACDLTTGQVSVGAPTGLQPTLVTVDPAAMTASPGMVEDDRQSLHLLVCRPGQHASYAASFDGAVTDAGTADDGKVKLDLKSLVRLDGVASLSRKVGLQSGDVLIGLDPELLTYYVTTVP